MDSDDVSIELLNVPFSGRILIVGCTCKGMWCGEGGMLLFAMNQLLLNKK